MSKPIIEETLSTTASTSSVVTGIEIANRVALGRNLARGMSPIVAAGCFQVVRVAATGDYEVELQGGICRADGTTSWSTVATVDQDSDAELTTFTIAPGASYRFSHTSGVDVICLIG